MIVLMTDYGVEGPYIGQVTSALYQHAPEVPVVTLFYNAPVHNPKASAYLLSAYKQDFPKGSVFLCVVDPAVGSGIHRPVIVRVDEQWFVGPDNGLFHGIARHGRAVTQWLITWQPERLSCTFHGRDLYAPVAARLATGLDPPGKPIPSLYPVDWPDDLYEVIYIDHFGNAMTGVRSSTISPECILTIGGRRLKKASTFGLVAIGEAFWYANSNGLVEIAVNQGRASEVLRIRIGDPLIFIKPGPAVSATPVLQ
jgi:hypothetical protein